MVIKIGMAMAAAIQPSIKNTTAYDKLKELKEIGRGGFGCVFRAVHKDWGPVAYKELPPLTPALRSRKNLLKDLEAEVSVHIQLRHRNIVTLMAVVFEQNHYGLILELAAYGDACSFLKKFPVGWAWKLHIASDVALAMNYLHTQDRPIIHGDLKIKNVLLDKGYRAKVSDFGLARCKQLTVELTQGCQGGTVTHIPPESWMNINARITEKFDVYAFGILLWELLAFPKPPFGSYTTHQIQESVKRGDRPSLTDLQAAAVPDFMITFVAKCWSQQPNDRPEFNILKDQLNDHVERSKQFVEQDRVSIQQHERYGPRPHIPPGRSVQPNVKVRQVNNAQNAHGGAGVTNQARPAMNRDLRQAANHPGVNGEHHAPDLVQPGRGAQQAMVGINSVATNSLMPLQARDDDTNKQPLQVGRHDHQPQQYRRSQQRVLGAQSAQHVQMPYLGALNERVSVDTDSQMPLQARDGYSNHQPLQAQDISNDIHPRRARQLLHANQQPGPVILPASVDGIALPTGGSMASVNVSSVQPDHGANGGQAAASANFPVEVSNSRGSFASSVDTGVGFEVSDSSGLRSTNIGVQVAESYSFAASGNTVVLGRPRDNNPVLLDPPSQRPIQVNESASLTMVNLAVNSMPQHGNTVDNVGPIAQVRDSSSSFIARPIGDTESQAAAYNDPGMPVASSYLVYETAMDVIEEGRESPLVDTYNHGHFSVDLLAHRNMHPESEEYMDTASSDVYHTPH